MGDATFGDAAAYDRIADFYDLEHADFDEDIGLYRNLAEIVGDPILELGCGSGRILLPLAADGRRVTGVDGSAGMLARARERAEAMGVSDRVTLEHADMRAPATAAGGPFGLVIVGLNSLLHLPTQEDQRTLLVTAYRVLDPRGQLVVDVLNPAPDLLHDLARSVAHEGSWTHPQGGTVDKWSSRRVIASEQRLETTVWYDHVGDDGSLQRHRVAFDLRYLHLSELTLMLEAAGFVEWHAYGGYELEPYDDSSERLIMTAEVTPSASATR
ncbi:MAG: class I SAM-dependent methyltransferase [Actinomycetota bacterium]|nr:class I SAM-dependent methyltransferase [Actinomycetota bacterium]